MGFYLNKTFVIFTLFFYWCDKSLILFFIHKQPQIFNWENRTYITEIKQQQTIMTSQPCEVIKSSSSQEQMTNGFTNNHQFSPRSTQEDNQLDVIYQGDQDADLRDQFLDNYISDGSSKYSPEIQIRLNTVISVVRSCYKNRESFEGTKGDNIKKLLPCLKQATKEEALHVYEGLEVIVKSWLSNVKRELRGTYKCHSPTNDRNAAQHNDYLKCVFVYYGELEKIYHVTCTMVPSLVSMGC